MYKGLWISLITIVFISNSDALGMDGSFFPAFEMPKPGTRIYSPPQAASAAKHEPRSTEASSSGQTSDALPGSKLSAEQIQYIANRSRECSELSSALISLQESHRIQEASFAAALQAASTLDDHEAILRQIQSFIERSAQLEAENIRRQIEILRGHAMLSGDEYMFLQIRQSSTRSIARLERVLIDLDSQKNKALKKMSDELAADAQHRANLGSKGVQAPPALGSRAVSANSLLTTTFALGAAAAAYVGASNFL